MASVDLYMASATPRSWLLSCSLAALATVAVIVIGDPVLAG